MLAPLMEMADDHTLCATASAMVGVGLHLRAWNAFAVLLVAALQCNPDPLSNGRTNRSEGIQEKLRQTRFEQSPHQAISPVLCVEEVAMGEHEASIEELGVFCTPSEGASA